MVTPRTRHDPVLFERTNHRLQAHYAVPILNMSSFLDEDFRENALGLAGREAISDSGDLTRLEVGQREGKIAVGARHQSVLHMHRRQRVDQCEKLYL